MATVNSLQAKGTLRPGYPVRIAVIPQIILLIYFEVSEWVPMFPWNDIRHGNGQETLDLVLAGVMIACIALTLTARRWAAAIAVLPYCYWLWLQIDSWWIPYINGASPRWQHIYRANFSETIKALPSSGTHLAPDACHLLLQLILVLVVISTIMAAGPFGRLRTPTDLPARS